MKAPSENSTRRRAGARARPEVPGMGAPTRDILADAMAGGWRAFDGPLTADLVQRPAEFGLGRLPARLTPDATVTSVCGFCSTGCGLEVHLKEGEAINLSADRRYPVNLGMACPKGWEALTPLSAPDRATEPLLRERATGRVEPVDWNVALSVFTGRFREIMRRHGPESVAFLSTGQICTEEMALLGALFKFGMGGRHGDSNTRQCMATSHAAYKESFGFDAPPFTYADLEQSDVLVLIGSNLCIAHPILWQRVLRNRGRPHRIVIDPRTTETAMNATQHLALRPKSDLTLLYGLAHLLARLGFVDRNYVARHTTGYAEFEEFLRPFTPERVAAETGLHISELHRCAETIGRGRAVSIWWTMGVNQGHESTRTAQAIINLALMTGNVGRPGTGPNSVTGQCNAMGSRLYANTSSLLGGRDFSNPAHREEVARILGFDPGRIPDAPSIAYDQIVDRVREGRIKGLWVVATNAAHSWIDQERFQEAVRRLEFLVVQDLYTTTETAQHAHLILPAAGWGEKEGTLINSERRLGVVRKVARAPGQALADFHIFRLVAEAWGCGELFQAWSSPAATFQILKALSAGRPCDITGIRDFDHLDQCGGIQWPWRAGERDPAAPTDSPAPAAPSTERRLFSDGRFFTPDGKARFVFETPRPPPEQPDAQYPYILLTGRGSSAQWHTLTRTGKSEVLRRLGPAELYVQIHPDDARSHGFGPGDLVQVVSRRGAVLARASITSSVQPGQVFLPMHDPGVNRLTFAAFDAYSRQPSYKYCAVRLERVPTPP